MQVASLCKRSRTPRAKKYPVDRLSLLPDDVLYQVLSSLDFLDVVRASVLSKRWRYVWKTLPYLNFNMDWYMEHNQEKNSERREPIYNFWDFIKWALLLRDASQIIRICLYSGHTLTDQLYGLLLVAAREKVRELSILDDYSVDELEFPRLLCETLAVLTVNFHDPTPVRVTAVFSNIRSLKLTRVRISANAAEKLLSSGCVKLEDVYLEDCEVRDLEQIDISAPNLKNLTIVNVCTLDKFWVITCFDSKLRICAPNLLSFCYIGPMLRGFALENTGSLENVTIRLLRVPQGYESAYKNHVFCPERLVGFNNVKRLTLSTLVVKYFCPIYRGPHWDTFLLEKVNRLVLELRHNAKHIEGLINLLKLSPNLEALVIRFKEIRRSSKNSANTKANNNRSTWKSWVEEIACLSYHVKFVRISDLNGTEYALELVKFLVRNGKVLEKMEIITETRKRRSFVKLVKLFKTSEVVVSFPEYAQRKILWFDKGDSDPEYED